MWAFGAGQLRCCPSVCVCVLCLSSALSSFWLNANSDATKLVDIYANAWRTWPSSPAVQSLPNPSPFLTHAYRQARHLAGNPLLAVPRYPLASLAPCLAAVSLSVASFKSASNIFLVFPLLTFCFFFFTFLILYYILFSLFLLYFYFFFFVLFVSFRFLAALPSYLILAL